MRFAKLHGLGNDFVLLDLRQGGSAPSAEQARALCDRHRGVGSDGVLSLLPANGADAQLLIHNPDGSIPEMCGNGARCAALWIATNGCKEPASRLVRLETDAGPRPCAVEARAPALGDVEIAMGVPQHGADRPLAVGARTLNAADVSMGNPHRVLLLDGAQDPEELAYAYGAQLCAQENANIEFVARLGPQRLRVVVWERGAGLTQACGTGACAVAAAAFARGLVDPALTLTIELPGGPLHIRRGADGQMLMRGPAQLVFTGEL